MNLPRRGSTKTGGDGIDEAIRRRILGPRAGQRDARPQSPGGEGEERRWPSLEREDATPDYTTPRLELEETVRPPLVAPTASERMERQDLVAAESSALVAAEGPATAEESDGPVPVASSEQAALPAGPMPLAETEEPAVAAPSDADEPEENDSWVVSSAPVAEAPEAKAAAPASEMIQSPVDGTDGHARTHPASQTRGPSFRTRLGGLFLRSRPPSSAPTDATDPSLSTPGSPQSPTADELSDISIGQSQVLRAVGRLLDDGGAVEAEIAFEDDGGAVDLAGVRCSFTWTEDSVNWVAGSYTVKELASFEAAARQQRGAAPEQAAAGKAELLRTLGQELDREGAHLQSVRCERNRFHVRASLADVGIIRHYYAGDELRVLSQQRQASRDLPPSSGRPHWSFGGPPSS